MPCSFQGFLKEEATNSAGSGAVAGIGVGPQGEPGIKKAPLIRRQKFAGHEVFEVEPEYYHRAVMGKRKHVRYSDYVGTDQTGEAIRQYGRDPKTAHLPIILKNRKTSAMVYLRYGRNKSTS